MRLRLRHLAISAPDKGGTLGYLAPMQPITTTEQLADACARMSRYPFVTVDTEFLRESTYYPKLCVAQMASTDEAVVIDALAASLDLAPFFALMANENVLKVFHAARQDIEICWHEAGIIPHPITDTQIAAMVLGYGDSVSYDQLVQRITGDALDKSHRFTDWTRRPLSGPLPMTGPDPDVRHWGGGCRGRPRLDTIARCIWTNGLSGVAVRSPGQSSVPVRLWSSVTERRGRRRCGPCSRGH